MDKNIIEDIKAKSDKEEISAYLDKTLFFLLGCLTIWIYLNSPTSIGDVKLPLIVFQLLFVSFLGIYALNNSSQIYISVSVIFIYSLFIGLNYFYYIQY